MTYTDIFVIYPKNRPLIPFPKGFSLVLRITSLLGWLHTKVMKPSLQSDLTDSYPSLWAFLLRFRIYWLYPLRMGPWGGHKIEASFWQIWGVWWIFHCSLLPGPLWPRLVVSVDQIDLLMKDWSSVGILDQLGLFILVVSIWVLTIDPLDLFMKDLFSIGILDQLGLFILVASIRVFSMGQIDLFKIIRLR